MPQAKTTQNQERPDVPQVSDLQHGDAMVQEEINSAIDLLKQQREVQKRITDNRDTLRLLDRREKLSEVQGAWLDAFYPQKQKGDRRSEADIAKTRQVRADALGVSVSEVSGD